MAATRLRLTDGVELTVDVALGELQAALQAALAERKMLEVHVGGGQFVVVNPQQVLYLQVVEKNGNGNGNGAGEHDADVVSPNGTLAPQHAAG